MSAYVVDEPTIHILVRAGLRHGLVARASADLVGQALLNENIASVTYRYAGDLLGGQLPGPNAMPHPITRAVARADGSESGTRAWITPAWYRYVPRTPDEPRLDQAKVLQVIAGYEYQSCEHPAWQTSAAKQYVYRLAGRIRALHPGIETSSDIACWNPSTIAAAHEVEA